MRKKTLTVMMLAIATPLQASTIEKSAKIETAIISEAQKSQEIVTTSSNSSFDLQAEIDSLESEVKGLETYQQHLKQVIDSQGEEITVFDQQLNEIAETRRSIIPLMYEMLEGLSEYVRNDMPIRQKTRYERVEKLRELMVQADVSDAEKFRRILEAYQIELDYVTKMGTYTGTVNIAGEKRQAEQLYVGHISYLARSLDKQHYWVWDNSARSWKALESSLNPELEEAYLVANKLASPSILRLPLSQKEISE